MQPDHKKIALVMPHEWAWRSTMETPVRDFLAQQPNVTFQFLTSVAEHRERLVQMNVPHFHWAALERPAPAEKAPPRSLFARTLAFLHRQINDRLLKGKAGFENLFFRFNHYHQFVIHEDKLKMSPERRELELRDGNYADLRFGQPFPRSWWVFRLLYWFHYTMWQHNNQYVEAFFQEFKPDLVVIVYPQNPKVKAYSIAARRFRVPMLGIIGSWDNPTTKGQVCAGIQHFAVQSQAMKAEMNRYHGVPTGKIEVYGWAQMDFYHQPDILLDRAAFFKQLNIPLNHRLLVFGAYPTRHGRHEPDIVRHIVAQMNTNAYGVEATLLVRPHPRDNDWERKFGIFRNPPCVIVEPPDPGRLNYLANLIHHADIVISHASTLALDAAGLDTCMINIAFDGDQKIPASESVRRYYDSNHYSAITRSSGTKVVESYTALDEAILTYLRHPETDQTGRERLRREQLDPFDGHASERLVKLIMQQAQQPYRPPVHYPIFSPKQGNF